MQSRHVGGNQYRIHLVILGALALFSIAARADDEGRCSVTAKIKEGALSLGDSIGKVSPWDKSKLIWSAEKPLTFTFHIENSAVNGGCPTSTSSHRGEMISQLANSFLCLLPNDTALPEHDADTYPCVEASGLDFVNVEFSSSALPLVEPPPQ